MNVTNILKCRFATIVTLTGWGDVIPILGREIRGSDKTIIKGFVECSTAAFGPVSVDSAIAGNGAAKIEMHRSEMVRLISDPSFRLAVRFKSKATRQARLQARMSSGNLAGILSLGDAVEVAHGDKINPTSLKQKRRPKAPLLDL